MAFAGDKSHRWLTTGHEPYIYIRYATIDLEAMLKAVLFDLYRTLIDITTDEGDPAVYEKLAHFLSYHRLKIDPGELQSALREGVERTMAESGEMHPETDVFKVFGEILARYGGKKFHPAVVMDVAVLYRSLTMCHFVLFPGVIKTLPVLRQRYGLGLVSDAQWVYAGPEIAMLGLDRFFGVKVISSLLGFKKPDPRMFSLALEKLDSDPGSSVYIGDDPERDLAGARAAGMRCLLFAGGHAMASSPSADHPFVEGVTGVRAKAGRPINGVFEDYRELPGLLAAM
jgi:putative hydrolase of the HAD superfamily